MPTRPFGRAGAAAVGAAAAIVLATSAATAPMTATGTLVFATAGDRADRLEIAVAEPGGTGVRKITHHAPGGQFPTWAASGRRVVFGSRDSDTGYVRLWSIRTSGTGLRAIHRFGEPSPSATRFARPTLRGVDVLSRRGKLLRHLPLRLGRDDFYDDPAVLWSPNDNFLAISVATESDTADYERIFVARVDGHDPPKALSKRTRRGEADDFALVWSRDGGTLLIEHAGARKPYRAFLVTAATGQRREVRNDFLERPFAASADLGSVTWVSRSGTIFTAQLAGGRKHAIAQAHGTRTGVGNVHLSLSPSGRKVAYADRDGIHIVSANGTHNRRLTSLGSWSAPVWSPDGRRLTFSVNAEAIYVAGLSGRVRLVTQSTWDDFPRWSPDGTRVALVRGPNGLRDLNRVRVVVIDRNGGRARVLGRGSEPQWSFDGGLVAFVDRAHTADPPGFDRLHAGDVVVAASDGTSRRNIGSGTAPVWSRTASRLLFLRYRFEQIGHTLLPVSTRVFVVEADGSGLREVPVPEDLVLYSPDWSPDGHTVSFAAVDGNYVYSALFVDVDHPEQTHAVDFADASAYVWSPDGEWLAFSDRGAIKVARPDGTEIRTVSRRFFQLSQPVWSPDQSALAYVACLKPPTKDVDLGTCDVYVAAADGSTSRRVTRTPGVERSLDWSAR